MSFVSGVSSGVNAGSIACAVIATNASIHVQIVLISCTQQYLFNRLAVGFTTSPGASFTCRRIEGGAERVNGATASGCRYAFRLNSCVRDATPCARPNSKVFGRGGLAEGAALFPQRAQRPHRKPVARVYGSWIHLGPPDEGVGSPRNPASSRAGSRDSSIHRSSRFWQGRPFHFFRNQPYASR